MATVTRSGMRGAEAGGVSASLSCRSTSRRASAVGCPAGTPALANRLRCPVCASASASAAPPRMASAKGRGDSAATAPMAAPVAPHRGSSSDGRTLSCGPTRLSVSWAAAWAAAEAARSGRPLPSTARCTRSSCFTASSEASASRTMAPSTSRCSAVSGSGSGSACAVRDAPSPAGPPPAAPWPPTVNEPPSNDAAVGVAPALGVGPAVGAPGTSPSTPGLPESSAIAAAPPVDLKIRPPGFAVASSGTSAFVALT
mmetsp:Transcript_16686/g.49897  ORF Transcript_16686/g.49897 Transcript_16686/m.49897 type:complete len:256 (-) Transcript_16686:408-1175(-)